ncbi:MAG: isoprenylcysteine carboxylmethyltransferase family protein [Vicinamibacterales bacterium]
MLSSGRSGQRRPPLLLTSGAPLALIVITLVALGLTGNLLSRSLPVIAVQLAAVALNLWARASFAKGAFRVGAAPAGSSLMRGGPYRLVRHPMYAAVLLFLWAGVAAHASALTMAAGLVVTVVVVARVFAEERLLSLRYPDYRAYARATWALVPFVF